MGRIQVVLPDYVEDFVRDMAKRKGDISQLITEALVKHYKIPEQRKESDKK